ncbi:MAG: rhomboid family intramembrane serine protease [Bosea sp. (in: a-proteobacteria)]
MFMPLHDGVPMRYLRQPTLTYTLIIFCVLIFGWQALDPSEARGAAIAAGFGMIPSVLFGQAVLSAELVQVPAPLSVITSIFLHASVMHLVGNMLFLWVFGDNVEDAMGHVRFMLFFLICGMAGALAHAFVNPGSQQPLIGASGAISGVIMAYLMLYPQVRIWGLAFKAIPLRIPALWAIGAWIAVQIVQAFILKEGQVGWWAHLGGLGAGLILTPLFIRREMKLFGRGAQIQP